MDTRQTRQARSIVDKMIEKGLDEMCSQMSDEELELIVKSLLKS